MRKPGRLKIAFVGSGGAARGLAHFGVLRACEELGIHPEIYVGASAGAVISAMYGQDIPLDVLVDGYRLPWRRRHSGPRLHTSTFLGAPKLRDVLDPGYLLSGVFSIEKLERYLAKHLPINDFRALPQPVFITAVDVDTGQRVVFGPGYDDHTPISQAAAASFCLPGFFRPYRIGKRFYLTGEMVKTLSADVAIAAGADVVIISNVYKPEERRKERRSIARSTVSSVIRQSFNILLMEKEQRGVELLRKAHPEVTFLEIAPDVGRFGYVNRFAVRALMLEGYKAALQVLADAKEKGIFNEAPGMSVEAPDASVN